VADRRAEARVVLKRDAADAPLDSSEYFPRNP
jgi:hypothetical protein